MAINDFLSSKTITPGQTSGFGKGDSTTLATVVFVYTQKDDIPANTPDDDKIFSEVSDPNSYLSENGLYYGAITYRQVNSSDTNESGLPVAYPLNRYNFTLPVKGEVVNIQNINGKQFYTPIAFQNSLSYNTNLNILSSTSATIEPGGANTQQNIRDVIATGIPNSSLPPLQKSKTERGKSGKYYKRNVYIHHLKPNEGDSLIQSKFGSSIRFSGYIHDDKNEGFFPAILIRNRENSDTLFNKKIFDVVTEDINADGSSIQITSGTYKTLYNTTINVKKEANSNYPSSDNLIGDQIVTNTGRLIFSSKSQETFFFSKKTFSIFTDDVITFDSEKGINFITQNGNIKYKTKNNKNIILEVDEGGKIFLGVDNAKEQAVLGNTLVDLIKQLIDAILKMTQPTPSGNTIAGPTNTAQFNAIKNQLETALSKNNYLK